MKLEKMRMQVKIEMSITNRSIRYFALLVKSQQVGGGSRGEREREREREM